MKKYLCLDYGLKHIGVAISYAGLAEPVKTVDTQYIFDYLKETISKEQIDAIIIGLSENEMAQKTHQFAHELTEKFHLPIEFQDETLTSYESRVNAAKAGKKRHQRHQKLDHLAAAQILQNFLDEKSQ